MSFCVHEKKKKRKQRLARSIHARGWLSPRPPPRRQPPLTYRLSSRALLAAFTSHNRNVNLIFQLKNKIGNHRVALRPRREPSPLPSHPGINVTGIIIIGSCRMDARGRGAWIDGVRSGGGGNGDPFHLRNRKSRAEGTPSFVETP